MAYLDFVNRKGSRSRSSGIDVAAADLNAALFDWQKSCVRRSLSIGRFALFEDCGLGKTIQQGSWAHEVARHSGSRVLIVAPLCVGDQTIAELQRFGIDSGRDETSRIQVINYERLHKVDASQFAGVVLDESSILKSVDGKTKQRILEMFADTPYKLACTATPAPNDVTELGNHAEFLGVMTNAEMLASFFVNKGQGRQSWELKGHASEAFYEWLATWSVFVSSPADLGADASSHVLPPIDYRGHMVKVDETTGGHLFFMGMGGIKDRSRIRRQTLEARVGAARAILLEDLGRQSIAWCGLNAEQESLAKSIGDDCVSVSGSDSPDQKRAKIDAFLKGDARVLVTKPKIVGFGMNFQCASHQVFVGLGDSYELYYQAVRRSWRFGQEDPVTIDIVLSDIEGEVLANVQRKERAALEMQKTMAGRMAEYQKGRVEVKDDATIESSHGDGWELLHGDCVEAMRIMDDSSVDFSVFSPPFSSLYTYSASARDMGNCRGSAEFFDHFGYFVAELLRILKPGRVAAVHCQQIGLTKARAGHIGLEDFRGDLIRASEQAGFYYHGEVCIDKCPQAQAIRTKSKSLLFVQLEKDSSWSRPGLADYIIILRKPGENAEPIKNNLSREEWIQWARPIWYGIRESDTLSAAAGRDEKDEKHICPLQLGTIERCVRLWSNPGETVFSPFAGVGSEGYQSILEGRRFLGVELKPSYYRQARRNLEAAAAKMREVDLFGEVRCAAK